MYNENRRNKAYIANANDGRACIQVAELEVKNGVLVCDRNKEFSLNLFN